jgi:protein-disulfide isomerase
MRNQPELDIKQFSDCFENSRRTKDVEADVKFGLSIGIHATPTFFVNGKRVEGVTTAQEIRKIATQERH